jgi:dipeptidyl aminopeptidase/acylaminoacyl peptidase
VIDVERRLPRRLTTESSSDVVPSWSKDGRSIYFASNRTGTYQVWKAPAEGGPAVQVTQNGGFAAFESPDGQFVFYAKFTEPGIWRVAVEGGEETLVLDLLQPGFWGYWAVSEQGIYFLNSKAEPRPAIEFYRFATRRATRVFVPEKDPFYGDPGLALSPDGRWILYVQIDQLGSDIMLVENFR